VTQSDETEYTLPLSSTTLPHTQSFLCAKVDTRDDAQSEVWMVKSKTIRVH